MRISTKGRYALRLMLDIAVHDAEEPVRLKDTAGRQSISVKYLEQIIASLVRGSLTLPFKPHNTQILYLSLLWAYFFVKFVKIMCASLH